jgi:simple sugar transport system ATP-binding protein
VSKSFPGVRALQGVDFSIGRGEIRALLGKNGAGKSTLIRLLTGAVSPDTGKVVINGSELEGRGAARTREAVHRGVRAVYQELSLIPHMSVTENMFMGAWLSRFGALSHRRMKEQACAALARVGLTLDPERLVSSLAPAERQLAEIARSLMNDPRIVILDEPTSSLTGTEAKRVIHVVKNIAAQGIAVIYVSHRMNEIRDLTATATVMRDGMVVATVDANSADTGNIVRMMLGHDVSADERVASARGGEDVIRVDDVHMRPKLSGVSFTLKKGEVLGIAGVLGSGRSELLRIVAGIDAPDKGRVFHKGTDVTGSGPAAMASVGIGFTPENRKDEGIFPDLGIDENIVVANFGKVSAAGQLSGRRICAATQSIIDRMRVRVPRTDTPMAALSGGNQQKVVIGRWVYADSRVLLLDEPTRGVDVDAKSQIYRIARQLAEEGRSVIFVSSEVEELPLVCDRVLVLRDGRIVQEFLAPDINADALMASAIAA